VTITEMNLRFIVAAYSVAWIVLLGYLFRVVRKGGEARKDYDRMVSEHSGEDRT
jgi:CcmD family protein